MCRHLAFVDQRLARLEPREVLLEQLLVHEIAGRTAARHMRRQQHVRHVPEWAVGRQRLHLVDVEAGTGNATLTQCRDQRRLVDDLAARDVDEIGARLHGGDLSRTNHVVARLVTCGADHHHVCQGKRLTPALARIDQLARLSGHARNRDHLRVEGLELAHERATDGAAAEHTHRGVLQCA